MDGVRLVFASEEHDKAVPVVLVHPPIEERVGEGGAHGHDVEDGVEQLILFEPQYQVQIAGQLEHVKRQPAQGKHQHHPYQHLGGLLAALDAVPAVRGAGEVAQLGPDAHVSIADDAQRYNVLQKQHGQAIDDGIAVGAVWPLLRAHGNAQPDVGDLLAPVLPEDCQGAGQHGRGGPCQPDDGEAGAARQAALQVEHNAAVALQGDHRQSQYGNVDAQGLGIGHEVAQHRAKLPLVEQRVRQGKRQADGVHHQVSQCQVGDEVVGDGTHVLIEDYHVDNQRVAHQA